MVAQGLKRWQQEPVAYLVHVASLHIARPLVLVALAVLVALLVQPPQSARIVDIAAPATPTDVSLAHQAAPAAAGRTEAHQSDALLALLAERRWAVCAAHSLQLDKQPRYDGRRCRCQLGKVLLHALHQRRPNGHPQSGSSCCCRCRCSTSARQRLLPRSAAKVAHPRRRSVAHSSQRQLLAIAAAANK